MEIFHQLLTTMNFIYKLYVVVTLVSNISCGFADKDDFSEELYIKQLPSGHLYAHFEFSTLWNTNVKQFSNHYHLFPKTVGDIILKSKVGEFHFSMTQGLWRTQKWGYPVNSAPAGGEIWAWFHDSVENVDKQWLELTSAISGVFCSSSNIVSQLVTVQPELSFRPMGIRSTSEVQNSSFVRYASLPREHVCTENLTPWKKLLPCFSTAGLSTLVNSGWLFDTNYHSLSIKAKPVCMDKHCNTVVLELSQSLSVVYDIVKEGALFDWSLKRLFGSVITKECSLSSISKIYIDEGSLAQSQCTLSPGTNERTVGTLGGSQSQNKALTQFAVYNLKSGKYVGAHIGSKCALRHTHHPLPAPPVYAHQFVTGYGQEVGGIMCDITNTQRAHTTIVYMLNVPWYIRLYVHTLKVTDDTGRVSKPSYKYYIPGKDRVRSHHLEVILKLEKSSTTHVSIQYELAFLKWTEYPPDANHGFYIPSSVISVELREPTNISVLQYSPSTSRIGDRLSAASPHFIRIYTESLLISLATPDFSMPYNVICLTCTVVAIAFGSVHNMTTRRLIIKPKDDKQPIGKLAKIKEKLKTWLSKIRRRPCTNNE